jgi:hypothetical protein
VRFLDQVHLANLGGVHPDQRHPDHAVHQHEGRGADAGEVDQGAEHDRQQEAAEAADQADDAGDDADVVGVLVGDVLEHAGLAEGEGDADGEQQGGEDFRAEMDAVDLRAGHGLHGELGLRIGHDEQADPGHPQHPPGHPVRAPFVRHPAAHRAQHAAGQGEAGRQEGRRLQVETVFADVVLGHPQGQRHVAAEHDRVVLAVLPDDGIFKRLELISHGDMGRHLVLRVVVGEEPEQDGGDQHGGGIDLGHHGPAVGQDDGRSHQLGHGGARVAGAEHAHGHALAFLFVPAGAVGDAHREGAAGQADEQADGEEVPELGGEFHQPDRTDGGQHQEEEDDAAAELIGPHAQRQADQGAGKHRRRDQHAELGFIETELGFDGDADDGKHHPHSETDREGQCAHHEHGKLLLRTWSHGITQIKKPGYPKIGEAQYRTMKNPRQISKKWKRDGGIPTKWYGGSVLNL